MTILANCKMTSATGKPSNYVILSEAKNLSSSSKSKPPEWSEMFRSAQHDRGIGFGPGLFALGT
jgi:hypothetical protein